MCWFFKRKKVEEYKCRHTWKDFPWYYNATYYRDTKTLKASIIAPYVCIHCKEQHNEILKSVEYSGYTYEKALELIDGWKEKYKYYMEDEVLVKEAIADMQLVDREKLALYESVTNPPPITALEKEMKDALKDFELQPQTATS